MLVKLIKIELLKTKRSLALLMMFICPLMVVLVNLLVFIHTEGKLVAQEGWEVFWLTNFGMWGYFMMPLYIALITALLNGIDHKSNGWRYLATLPISQKSVFIAKFLLAWIYLVGANIILFLSILLLIFILNSVGFSGDNLVNLSIVLKLLYTCIESLAILIIQHLVSWRWQNIVAPLGLGVLATFSVMQFSSSKYWVVNPWTYSIMTTNAANINNQTSALIYSAIITTSLLIIGSYWSEKREIHC